MDSGDGVSSTEDEMDDSDGDRTEDENSARRPKMEHRKTLKGKNAENVHEMHVIYRTRYISSGSTLQLGQAGNAILGSPNIQEVNENAMDLVDEAVQTEKPEVHTHSAQTEPLDEPPSYAESHPAKEVVYIRSSPFGRHLEIWSRQLPFANTVIPHLSPVCNTIMATVLDSNSSFFLYSTVCILLGMVSGFSMSTSSTASDRQLWLAYNSLQDQHHLAATSSLSYWFHE